MHPSVRATVFELSSRRFDLLVIGGGITGAGIAREAALRGLSVALVDRHDFAGGTSSRSSRLVHGGLRYLEHRQFALVRESLAERRVLLSLAPHLVRPLGFVFPMYRSDRVPRWKLELGLTLYDFLASRGNVPRHRRLSKRGVLGEEPRLRERGLRGGALYWDAQCDDARLTLAAVRAASALGAMVMNHACVIALDLVQGRASGAVVEDQLTGAQATVAARVIVNATGPWSDTVRRLEDPGATALLRPTRGAHVLVPRERIGHAHGITFLSPIDGRVMFVLPWGDRSYIGTTDTDAPAEPERVAATPEDVLYLLRSANAIFPEARLGPEDVSLTWAGLRPLVLADRAGRVQRRASPGARSREHVIQTGPAGMLTIAGGKLTTFRRMGAELVDRAQLALGQRPAGRDAERLSAIRPLPGGEPFDSSPVAAAGRARGLAEATTGHLIRHHGSDAARVIALVDELPVLSEPLHPHHPSIGAEVVHAVRHEFARRLEDVMLRRLALVYETDDAGQAAVAPVVRIMARELGWDEARIALERERHRDAIGTMPGGRELSSP